MGFGKNNYSGGSSSGGYSGGSGKGDGTGLVVLVLILLGGGVFGVFGASNKGDFLWNKIWGDKQSVATKSVEKGTKKKVDSLTEEASKGNTVYDSDGAHDLGDADTSDTSSQADDSDDPAVITASELPKAKKDAVILTINHDKAGLNKDDFANLPNLVKSGQPDDQGRTTGAIATITPSTRSLATLKTKELPTGWKPKSIYVKTPLVSGATKQSVADKGYWMTGTKWLYKTKGTYDKKVLRYAHDNQTKIYYSVTPLFKDDEPLARAVQLRAVSADKKLNFNKVIYNIQPNTSIKYGTGEVSKN